MSRTWPQFYTRPQLRLGFSLKQSQESNILWRLGRAVMGGAMCRIATDPESWVSATLHLPPAQHRDYYHHSPQCAAHLVTDRDIWVREGRQREKERERGRGRDREREKERERERGEIHVFFVNLSFFWTVTSPCKMAEEERKSKRSQKHQEWEI